MKGRRALRPYQRQRRPGAAAAPRCVLCARTWSLRNDWRWARGLWFCRGCRIEIEWSYTRRPAEARPPGLIGWIRCEIDRRLAEVRAANDPIPLRAIG